MKHITHLLLYSLFFLGILLGCQYKSNQYRDLQKVDYILQHGKNNEAWYQISKIDTTTLKTKEDKAYYKLLQIQIEYILYKPIPNNAIKDLNYCIDYYKNRESEKLARCYLYKGNILYERGLIKDAIWNLKKCEELAEKQHNPIILDKLYRSMITINNQGNNFSTALIYGRKFLKVALNSSNKEWLATAYNFIAVSFHGLKQDDSARYYINKCIPIFNNVSRQGQVVILDNIGYLNMNYDQQFSLKYLHKAAMINPSADTYDNMAQILAKQGYEKKADSLWHLSLKKSNTEQKSQIIKNIIKHKIIIGKQNEINKLQNLLLIIKDSLSEQQRLNKIEVLQDNYDQQEIQKIKDRNIEWLNYTLFFVIIFCIVCFLYWLYKNRKIKYIHNLLQQKIEIKENIINKLKAENKKNNQIINENKELITTIKGNKQKEVARGHILYNNIRNGGSITQWSKEDFSSFFDYYSNQNTEFMSNIILKHSQLTKKEKLYLCLINEGLDKSQIANIMKVAESTLRNFKYKIKLKKN